jgi:hypothetical protein
MEGENGKNVRYQQLYNRENAAFDCFWQRRSSALQSGPAAQPTVWSSEAEATRSSLGWNWAHMT